MANHQRKLDDLLFDAINDGDWKRVRQLVRSGARSNRVFGHGWTPLTWAIVHKKWKVSRILLQLGADPNLGEQAQTGALNFACGLDSKSVQLMRLLVKHGIAPNLLLHPACKVGTVGTVRQLLQRGADANLLDGMGELPLREARSPAIVRELFRHGANPFAYNADRTHPLHFNAISGRPRIVRALLAGGVPPNLPELDGVFALEYTISFRFHKCARILLEGGADPNLVSTNRAQTPLMLACWYGHTKLAALLLKHGASPNRARQEALRGLEYFPEKARHYRRILRLLRQE